MTAFVTTSWDDGGALDARLALLLAEYGVTGTFYWTLESERFPLPSEAERADILDAGIEIGSHTVTHPDMRKLDAAALAWELTESRDRLEQITGRAVDTFCYPFGYHNRAACDAVARAGYRLGRTTMGFRTDVGDDAFRVPTTIQVYPHGRRVHLTHSLREGNLAGLTSWMTSYRGESDLVALTELALDRVVDRGGVLHLWGHSWELEEFDLWDTLSTMLSVVAGRDDVAYVPNGALVPA